MFYCEKACGAFGAQQPLGVSNSEVNPNLVVSCVLFLLCVCVCGLLFFSQKHTRSLFYACAYLSYVGSLWLIRRPTTSWSLQL